MNLAQQPQTSTGAPVIDFASVSTPKLAQLLDAFSAAERELGIACTAEDKFPTSNWKRVKVLGGITTASTLIVDGREPVRVEASEWFYYSREQIDSDYEKVVLNEVKSMEDIAAVEERFKKLRAECDRQMADNKKKVPRGYQAAKRRLSRAHCAVSAAERKIIEFKPVSLTEALTLLEYAHVGERNTCFSPQEEDLQEIMLNVASLIRQEVAS